MTYRVTVITGLQILWMLAAIHIDGPECVRSPDIEDVHAFQVGKLDELHAIRSNELPCPSGRLAPSMRLITLERCLPEVVQRASPWLKRYVFHLDIVRKMRICSGPVHAIG